MNLGLRGKILLIVGLVTITVCTGVLWSASSHYYSSYAATLQSRSLAIAKSLSLQMERITGLGIKIESVVGFEEQCAEAVRAYQNVDYAMLVSHDGTILFHNDTSLMGAQISSKELLDALPRGEFTLKLEKTAQYVAVEPVRGPDNNQAASLVVGFSQRYIDEELKRINRSMLLIVAIGSLFGFSLLYLMLDYFIIRPSSKLVEVITHIRSHPGDYSPRIVFPVRNNEIGAMIESVNQLLEDIQDREAKLIQAKESSDHANKSKSVFLAAMSHDLRTPMHAILSMNELMHSTQLNERQQRYTHNIEKAGRWLLGIINDILEFAKIESGKLELLKSEFELHQLVQDAVGLQEEIALGKKLTLSQSIGEDVPRWVLGDGPRLMQILTNLISNAIRYTDQGTIQVQVINTGSHIVFSVTDTGIGVDPEKIHLLWEPFVQVAAADGLRRSGTGLGLSIVKQLAEAMGGTVGVDTSLGKGATFWFTAHLEPVQAPEKKHYDTSELDTA